MANLVAVAILSEAVNEASSLALSAADITPALLVVALSIVIALLSAVPVVGSFFSRVIATALASAVAPVALDT